MHIIAKPSRRGFLQYAGATLASFILPKSLWAKGNEKASWFVHAVTGASWEVTDPAQWSLANAGLPVLDRASEGLRHLTPNDGDRIIRLVTRRCGLNLIEISPFHIGISYWGQNGLADVRPFFKKHQLARNNVVVVLKDRKKEIVARRTGNEFLFGEEIFTGWPLKLFLAQWRRRFEQQPDDWKAAPGTWSGYTWAGLESNQIPWAALKCVWRRGDATPCQNCDEPTMLVNFGDPWTGMLRRSPTFIHVCCACRRAFLDDSIRDVGAWMDLHLDEEVRPDFIMIWQKQRRLER
jgi:hypothetical protein